ncbi:MAG: outer membrane protein transport protein [Deltaproteobacteria bacterium]|nr:outer membrane protein transport protein [Deltaproteobacteria bacterium]
MIRTSFILATILAAAGTAHAGGSALAQQSATAGGTAGAGTARTDDASAAWFNPAALADGGGLRFGIGLTLAFPKVDARAMDGSWQTSTDSGVKTPPHLYASWAQGRWMASLSVGVPFGGGASWPDTWEGRHEIVSTNLQVFRIAPAFGYRFGRVRIAAGPQLDLATLEITRGLDFVDTEGTVDLALSGQALGAHASVFVEAADGLDVGLTYKSRTQVAFAGDADFDAPDEFAVKTSDQQASSAMTMPDRFVLGGRYRYGDLAVLADIDLTLWSVNEELIIDFEREETPDAVTANQWKSTVGLRAGAEYGYRGWVFRSGGFYDPSPAPQDNLRPTSPDSNRIGATVGLSRRLGSGVSIDAFYEYMRLIGRSTENMDTLQAEYSGQAQFLGVGLRLQPGR